MADTNTVQFLTQAGAVGIALACLWIIYKMNSNQNDTFKNITDDHRLTIDRNTDAWNKNTEVLAKLSEKIDNH